LVYFRFYGEEGGALKSRLAVLADYASVNHDGRLNIMGVIQEVNTPVLPFPLPPMYLVFSLEAEPAEYGKEYQIRVVLRYENGEGGQILDLKGPTQVPRPERPGRVIINQLIGLAGLNLKRAGTYTFSIGVGDEEGATVPLDVHVVEDELTGASENESTGGS
jgi:uncharacterized protein DUF6941